MPYDFNEFKVPIFTNINDKPVEPTASKAGNGADMIERFNSLIDQLQSTLNSLPSTLPIFDWTVVLPSMDGIQKIDVYYINTSESKLYASNSIHYLNSNNLLKAFVSDNDFNPQEPTNTLNISNLIIDNGCGYYIFVVTNTDDQILRYFQIDTDITTLPKGGARLTDEFITFSINDFQGVEITIRVQPLTVVQPASSVQITLFNNLPS